MYATVPPIVAAKKNKTKDTEAKSDGEGGGLSLSEVTVGGERVLAAVGHAVSTCPYTPPLWLVNCHSTIF